MSLLDRLERIFGRFAVPNITLWLIVGQAFVLFAAMARMLDPEMLVLFPADVIAGQWWRAITFLFLPPYIPLPGHIDPIATVFLAFGWYMFYLMGSALEGYWGTFRYNAFLILGFVFTVGLGFAQRHDEVTNLFLAGTVFLAFAYLNPDFEIILFFILPVRIKWLALIVWIGYAYQCVVGSWSVRLQVVAAVGNFLLFFSRDIIRTIRNGRRTMARKAERVGQHDEPRHVCHVCGKTDLTNPELDFRYCSKCAGDQCYCPEHIQNHEHVTATENEPGA
jgi:hypothetical protein